MTRIAILLIAVLLSALVYLTGVVPWLIGSAYAGTNVPLLNDLIMDQNVRPLAHYRDWWSDARLVFSVCLLGAGAALALVFPLLRRGRAVVDRSMSGAPYVSASAAALLGGTVGWVGGMFEAIWAWMRFVGQPNGPAVEMFWMAPSAGAVLGALLGTTLVVGRSGRSKPGTHRKSGTSLAWVTAAVFFGAVFSAIQATELGIHKTAAGVLALGVGVQGGRILAARPALARRLGARTAAAFAVLSLLIGLGIPAWEAWRGKFVLDGLVAVETEAPNVLLLVIDTQRASRMSLYGNPRPTTPNLDALADGGFVFDRAISTTAWTLPAHASLLTGRWTHDLSADWFSRLDAEAPTLAEVLSESGYATGAFVGNVPLAAGRTGLSRGFAVYLDYPVSVGTWMESHRLVRWIVGKVRGLLGLRGMLGRKRAPDVHRQFLRWSEGVDRPYFAMLNYYDVHDPYESPAPFSTLYRDTAPRFWLPAWTTSADQSAGDAAEMLDAYDSALTYLDAEIGTLLQSLAARGDLTNTLVVVTSDHGEQFAERKITLHSNSLYMDAVRVPLVIHFSGTVPEGGRSRETVSIRDVPATVLDLIGATETASALPGHSLARYWESEGHVIDSAASPAHLSLSFNGWSRPNEPIEKGDMRGLVSGSLHYIRNGDDSEELYNLDTDPTERDNLADDPQWQGDLRRLRAAVPNRSGS